MSSIYQFFQEINERDSYTSEHCQQVACLMAGFAEYLELLPEEVGLAYLVGMVHDVGKVGIPDHILNKPGRLTNEEFAVIKQHPALGAELLAQVKGLEKVANIVRHHHERYDGRGYIQGLGGTEIPFFSRMLAVCDSFDAMTSVRCYRTKPASVKQALGELFRCAGSQFDPVLCQYFVEFIDARRESGKLTPGCLRAASTLHSVLNNV